MAGYTPNDLTGALTPINPELEKISVAIKEQLSRTGGIPNSMEASLDMNSNRVLNLPKPITDSEPARLKDLRDIQSGGGEVSNETDPTVPDHVKLIEQSSISNWNTAYGWGDHAAAGYLTSFTETDPTVPSHVKSITTTEVSNWNTAFSWGDHRVKDYNRVFDSVNDMKSKTDLSVGDTVAVKQYRAGTNEGFGVYDIVTSASFGVVDERGDHSLPNNLVAVLRKNDWVTPENYGADGTAANDSPAFVSMLKECRKITTKPGRTYQLSADVSGTNGTVITLSGTIIHAYGSTFALRGTTAHNGFRINQDLKDICFFGGTFTNPDNIFTVNINIYGYVTNVHIKDVHSENCGQYHVAVQDTSAGFNGLLVEGCRVKNCDPNSNNLFSMPFEFFPKSATRSTGLVFRGNFAEQVGRGNCFKIHDIDNSFIYDNYFKRTTNFPDSESQAVVLSGRPTTPCNNIHFHNNTIEDANTSYNQLYIGSGSENVFVINNTLLGTEKVLWIGNSLENATIQGNTLGVIKTLDTVNTNNLANVTISGNTLEQSTNVEYAGIQFRTGTSVALPDVITNVNIKDNCITGPLATISVDSVTQPTSVQMFIEGNVIKNTLTRSYILPAYTVFVNNYFENDPTYTEATYLVIFRDNIHASMNSVRVRGGIAYAYRASGNNSSFTMDTVTGYGTAPIEVLGTGVTSVIAPLDVENP